MGEISFMLNIFQSFFEVIVLACSSLSLLGYNLRGKSGKIILLGLIVSLVLELIRVYFLGFHTILGLLVYTLSVRLIFKITVIRSFVTASFGLILLGLLESMFLPLLSTISGISMEDILYSDLYRTFFSYPLLIILSIIAFVAQKNQWYLINLDLLVISKINMALVIVVLLQMFFFTFLNITNYYNQANFIVYELKSYPLILNLMFVISVIASIVLVKQLFFMAQREAIMQAQEIYLNNIDDLFNSYRAQRHDFHNHLQSLYIMVRNSGNAEALNYLELVLDDFHELNELIRLKNAPVVALLKAKLAVADSKNIDLKLSIKTSLEAIGVKPHELVCILGNLIDNAIDAAECLEAENRKIIVELSRFKNMFIFKISNPYSVISEVILKKLFHENFTTKDISKHSGIGLSTVMKLVNKNKGETKVQCNEQIGTEFTVILPRGE